MFELVLPFSGEIPYNSLGLLSHRKEIKCAFRFIAESGLQAKGATQCNSAANFAVFFCSVFVVSSEAFFWVLERLSAPFWAHVGVILRSDSLLFSNKSLFKNCVFRVDETILFKVREGSISVLFRSNFGLFCQANIFLCFYVFLWSPADF